MIEVRILNNSRPEELESQFWSAPAKLNLFLHILGQRKDGYHQLQSVIQFIDLCDELTFELRSDSVIHCENSNQAISQQEDLAIRAAKILQKKCSVKQGIDIKLNKVIPLGAGLGGGSSNAATTLLALNQIWGCGLELQELEGLGRQLGADVPVFIRGEASWVDGIGEQLEPVKLPEPWYAVVYPNVHMNTRQMFADSDLTRNCTPIKIRDFLNTEDWQQATQNVFEPIARRQQAEVERAFQWLNRYSPARLTGTGSGMFIVCESQEQAHDIVANCPAEWLAFAAKGLNRSPVSLRCEYN